MNQIATTEELESKKREHAMLLFYVGGRSCSVCHVLEGKVEALLGQYPDIASFKIEAEDAPELAAALSVFSVPALILFIEGRETMREAGIVSLGEVARKIERYHALYTDAV